MCFGGDEVDVSYQGPTQSDKANLDIARENRELYNQYFKGLESEYLGDIQQNLSGYAESQVAADTAQSVAAAKQSAGPILANRGQATSRMGTFAAGHGAGLAAGITKADTLGKQSIIDKNMIALQNASRLGANISSSAQQLATQSTTAANQAANIAYRADMGRYADTTALMTDVAGGAAFAGANKFKTKSFLGGNEGPAEGLWGSVKGSAMDKTLSYMGAR